MRENLIQYVNLLFVGAADSDEIRQEILQNTLDRYDDLVNQGKSPEAAYRLAISGIGDVNEILGHSFQSADSSRPSAVPSPKQADQEEKERRTKRAVAIAFYILCPVPVIILGEIGTGALGVALMFLLIAAATALMIMNSDEKEEKAALRKEQNPRQELKKGIGSLVWAIGMAAYFILSFATNAWYITWVLFPIIGCVQGLTNAIIDLKEVTNHEK